MTRFCPCSSAGVALSLGVLWGASSAVGAPSSIHSVLPPELPWSGKSLELVAKMRDPWITPAEASDFATSPSYDETVGWLRKLAAAAPQVQLVSLGRSPQGRDLWMAVVTKEGSSTPAALAANGRATLFAQGGIHAGEIDGKDAGLMLLRDLTVGGRLSALLDRANLLFVPIYNVDGHERRSPYGRFNQRGPAETGWRNTAQNLNLNRDYMKLDAPESRAMVAALGAWNPDLYLDLHVTDGGDYQYDITFGGNGEDTWSPAIDRWLSSSFTPAVRRDLAAMGHVPGPLVLEVDSDHPEKGFVNAAMPPRFSTGYGDLRHLPAVLVENHSLKPYRQRVLGTRVLLESALRVVADGREAVRAAIHEDQQRHPARVVLDWKLDPTKADPVQFAGVAWRRVASPTAGGDRVEFLGKPAADRRPWLRTNVPAKTAGRPVAYWVPAECTAAIERLRAHGIRMDVLTGAFDMDVEMLRIAEPKLASHVSEGRVAIEAKFSRELRREHFAPGSVRVPTDQPLGDLAVVLLEPEASDSLFHWGFFAGALERTEYAEGYVMDPTAEQMLAADPALKAEWEKLLKADPQLAASPEARRDWLYRHTRYFDDRYLLYPVGRELAPAKMASP